MTETIHPGGLLALPAGSTDCHMHVFGDPEAFPGAAERTYQPTLMPLDRYRSWADPAGIERFVIVQPSAYGADNRYTLKTLRENPRDARAVIVIDETFNDEDLVSLDRIGVRGIRLNLMTPRMRNDEEGRDRLRAAVGRVAFLGWHVQIYADLDLVAALLPAMGGLGVPVIFDHMGGAKDDLSTEDPRFVALLDQVAAGTCWVKLSGADIVTWQNSDFPGATPFAHALLAANPSQVVWGSDWPHLVHHASGQGDSAPDAGYRPVEETALLRHLRDWCPDDETWRRVLVDNPARLYRF